MAKCVGQIRFCDDDNKYGFNSGNITRKELTNGSWMTNISPLSMIGIQAPFLNFGSYGDTPPWFIIGSGNPIYIGRTGIYELDTENYGDIDLVKFSPNYLQALNEYNNNLEEDETPGIFIIDYVYDKI